MPFLAPPARGRLYWPMAMAMLVVHSTAIAKLTPLKVLAGYAAPLVVSVVWERLYTASLERENGRLQEAIVATRMLIALLRQVRAARMRGDLAGAMRINEEAGCVAEVFIIEYPEFREFVRLRPAINNVDDTVD